MRKVFLVVGLLATILTVLILVLVFTTQEGRTPPPAITGLIATDASNIHDGQIDLVWSPSDAEDFAYYAVYVAETEITDVTGLSPIGQINDRADATYQTTRYRSPGLSLALFAFMEDIEYWFVVTAVDLAGNESKVGTSVSATIEKMPPLTVFIRINNIGFGPKTTTVPIGAIVTWANIDVSIVPVNDDFLPIPHSVISDTALFQSELPDGDVRLTYTFTEPGVFGYYCGLHGETGTVIVAEEAVEELGPAGN